MNNYSVCSYQKVMGNNRLRRMAASLPGGLVVRPSRSLAISGTFLLRE